MVVLNRENDAFDKFQKFKCACPSDEIALLIPYGLVARIPGFHPGGSGSIPGMGNTSGVYSCDLNNFVHHFVFGRNNGSEQMVS